MNKLKNFIKKHSGLFEIVRFLIVGGIATLLDLFVTGIVLYAFDPSLYPKFFNVFFVKDILPTTTAAVVSTGFGFIAGLVLNYILSILFVFNHKGESKSVKGAVIFGVLSLGGLGLHYLGMYVGFDLLGLNVWAVKIVMTLIVLVYNYLSKRLLLFRERKKEQNYEFKEQVLLSQIASDEENNQQTF